MRKKYFSVFFVVLICTFIVNSMAISSIESNQNNELEEILLKSSQYCSKLAHAVLDFVCKEKVAIDFYSFNDKGTQSRIEL